jgi:hypothetical protein
MTSCLAAALVVSVVLLSFPSSSEARDFPGAVMSAGIGYRTSQSATLEGEAGYLWPLTSEAYEGAGPVVAAATGLGGVSVGGGAMVMFECIHAFGCQAVVLEAEAYRPWLLSDWDRQVALGGRLSYTVFLVRLSVAMYGPGSQNDGYRYMAGIGVQLPY